MIRITVSTLLALTGLLAAGGIRAQTVDTVRAVPIPNQTFLDARGIGVDPIGALYVADAGRDVIVKMDPMGLLLATIGGPGSREGEFDDPGAVDPTNGLVLYVADAGNHRIQIFSKAFAFLGSIPLVRAEEESSARATYRRRHDESDGFPTGIPIGVATSGANEIFAVDTDRRAVLKWNENRRLTGTIGGLDAGRGALGDPVDVWVGPESLLYVADRGAGAVVVFDHFGTFVRSLGEGRLVDVRAVAVSGGKVIAALPRALVVYDRTGRFDQRIEIDIPEDIVDVAAAPDGTLYLLGARRVYRLFVVP